MSMSETADQLPPEEPRRHYQITPQQWGVGALVFVIVGLLLVGALRHKGTGGGDSVKNVQYAACDVAHKFVKNQLKAPSTASFQSCFDSVATSSGDTWTVTGYVDAQNGFGAKLRNTFVVVETYHGLSGGNYHFELVSANVQ